QLEDLDIVTAVVYTPFVFAVPKDAPWNTLEELAAWGREHPGEMRVVASGTGSGVHIAVMAWAAANDVEIRFIPTDGTGESKTVMLGGGADLAAFSYQLGAEDSFKLLALTGSERLSIIPDVPTLEELGFNIPSGNLTGYGTVPGVPEAHKAWLLEMFKLSIADERFQSAYSETSDIRAWNPQDVRDYEVQQLKTVHPLLEELGLATRPLDR
ncbi:MAG: tripartite tricarboxylate transporter substrate-binding protein, partial [Propionibacteriaceae bacterium]|nr:tripartite tricarboxylate transporter substrate-binding protein [Propionibacteriaceae bacterium]